MREATQVGLTPFDSDQIGARGSHTAVDSESEDEESEGKPHPPYALPNRGGLPHARVPLPNRAWCR